MEPRVTIRRNLFGIRLNHEQLKQDLTEMCREQLESQKQRWNFDFEQLKPVSPEKINHFHHEPRYEWNLMNCTAQLSYNKAELSLATFDPSELESDFEREQEDDDALLVPAFYQLQRMQKMKKAEITLKQFVQLNKATQTDDLQKPTKKKKKSNKKKRSSNSKLIITFSENRKDTLRSATHQNNENNSNNNKQLKQTTLISKCLLKILNLKWKFFDC